MARGTCEASHYDTNAPAAVRNLGDDYATTNYKKRYYENEGGCHRQCCESVVIRRWRC